MLVCKSFIFCIRLLNILFNLSVDNLYKFYNISFPFIFFLKVGNGLNKSHEDAFFGQHHPNQILFFKNNLSFILVSGCFIFLDNLIFSLPWVWKTCINFIKFLALAFSFLKIDSWVKLRTIRGFFFTADHFKRKGIRGSIKRRIVGKFSQR
jgi:hypothetical protein